MAGYTAQVLEPETFVTKVLFAMVLPRQRGPWTNEQAIFAPKAISAPGAHLTLEFVPLAHSASLKASAQHVILAPQGGYAILRVRNVCLPVAE